MANTYHQLFIHCIFSTKGRFKLIHEHVKEDLYQFITGIIKKEGHKLMAINGMPDHIHLFIGYNPDLSLAALMRSIKSKSTQYLKSKKGISTFAWQEGYGAFSYAKSQVPVVCKYIENQEQHHKKASFEEEYVKLLERFGVAYNPKYLWG